MQPGFAIAIDFGELTTGLGAVLGMARGMMNERTMTNTSQMVTRSAGREFGRITDARSSEVAHVYEYGQQGSYSGRLWNLVWSGSGGTRLGTIAFRRASVPTQVGDGIDERLVSAAATANRTIAQHEFPDKAQILETKQVLTSIAGQNKDTTRIGGDVTQARSLVYIDNNGQVRFAQRWVRSNEFYGKFRQHFFAYWTESFMTQGVLKMNRGFTNVSKYGGGEVLKAIAGARVASTPRIPRTRSGVFARDRGRPYTGIRLRESDTRRVERSVSKRMETEMAKQWRA